MAFFQDESLITDLRERLAAVRAEIDDAARRSGRAASAVRLIAVTKTHPAAVLQAAVQAGVTEIGENYLQEAREKFIALGWPESPHDAAPVLRHAIGHIQTNKVPLAVRWFDMIHTVDSVRIAEAIARAAAEAGRVVPVLLQINVSKDPKKNGFFFENVEGIFPALAKLAHIHVEGLMTIGRFDMDVEAARTDFRALRIFAERLARLAPPQIHLHELSMGMSHDFAVAIEEGATMIRVGSRLFGPRPTI